jgi:spectrin alpha
LDEIEGQILSVDVGKNLTSVQNLQKKHGLLEVDVMSHHDRIEGIKVPANKFVERDHFDADNICNNETMLTRQYTALAAPMQDRQNRLGNSTHVKQLFRVMEDEAASIREREPGKIV